VVIIGRGDSGKTTILKAIAAVLSPNWNLSFSDWDFYQCNTEDPIVIEAVVKDLPEEFKKENKYGLCLGLLKEDGTISYDFEDMSEDEAEKCEKVITIRLTVNEELIPQWEVVSGPTMENLVDMSPSDRAKLKMFQVSDYIDNHFSYSKGSPLYALLRQSIEDKKLPEKKLAGMVRAAYSSIKEDVNFEEFGEIKDKIVELAQGVGLNITELSTLLEFKENAFTESNISLHSDNIPYKLHGKGSKRLLSIAIQKGLVEEGGIVLIDELEQGMEPDRSRNLACILKKTDKGQVFVTTHSRSVIAEVSAENLFLIHKGENEMRTFGNKSQGLLRRIPESVLAKRVICCEGATELGIIRAFDDYIQQSRGYGLSSLGIVYVDCHGGDKFYRDAIILRQKGIDACVMADDDTDKDLDKAKKAAAKYHVRGVLCDKGKAIEDMLFAYLPWEGVVEMLYYAEEVYNHQKIYPVLSYPDLDSLEDLTDETEQQKVREECAKRAKEKEWYKRIDHGEFLGKTWITNIDQIDEDCGLVKEYEEMMDWIGDDIN
jgi:predicted ATPase